GGGSCQRARTGFSAGGIGYRAAAGHGGKPGQQRLLAVVGGAEYNRMQGSFRDSSHAGAGTGLRRRRLTTRPAGPARSTPMRLPLFVITALTVAMSAHPPEVAGRRAQQPRPHPHALLLIID